MSKTKKWIPKKKGKIIPVKRKHPKKVVHERDPYDQNPMESIREWAERCRNDGVDPMKYLK